MFRPIYEPRTRAREYCDIAVNIYTGCNHGCTYCYAAKNFRRWHPNEDFSYVEPRPGIVEAVKAQLAASKMRDKTIMLCFTCDPYPAFVDTSVTREVIRAIKNSGNHVQILTKCGMRALRDFDLLDENDSFGVTISTLSTEQWRKHEPNAACPVERREILMAAQERGIKTWVSCEPVLDADSIYIMIKTADYIDLFKIGKLNYYPSDIDWGEFGRECERLCKRYGRNYYIKDDLRNEMGDHH